MSDEENRVRNLADSFSFYLDPAQMGFDINLLVL